MSDLSAFSSSLILPALILAALGWLVPKLLSLVFPEGVRPLMLLAFTSTLVMALLGAAFFAVLYVLQGIPVSVLFEGGIVATIGHFGRLSLISALLWGPLMILSVASLPRHWTKETW